MSVLDYSISASSNTSLSGIGIQGSNKVSNFDNALRQLMADIATGIPAASFMATGYATKAANYTVAVSDKAKMIDCTATLELDLPAAATAGAGFYIIVKANGGDVTVDPDGTENINGASTSAVIDDGESAMVVCTGTAWHTVFEAAPVEAASTTVAGIVELATDAEAQTGTDTARAITPANLQAVTATETRKGVVELATTAEAEAGTDTARAVTPAGVAAAIAEQAPPAALAKAWVNFNGTGTVAIRDSFNVSSITDLGTGRYRINFTTPMPSANYAVVALVEDADGSNEQNSNVAISNNSVLAASFELACGVAGASLTDVPTACAIVFG